jgi:site-specific DNA-methyltransferase (adenine-specific)
LAGLNKKDTERYEVNITKGKSEWEGWGTALKPAVEPLVLARKPFVGGIAQNVLAWGTGGLNIDGSRVGNDGGTYNSREALPSTSGIYSDGLKGGKVLKLNEGRFPANVIFDEEAGRILDEQSGFSKGKIGMTQKATPNTNSLFVINSTGDTKINDGITDFGGASRFFYCPKASKKDRNEGLSHFEDKNSSKYKGMKFTGSGNPRKEVDKNIHPTVKPTKLMEYLVTLITPKGGVILDPFLGSGSTGKAAVKLGYSFIGIEKEKEYFDIAKARIEHAKGTGLFATEINQNEV